MSDIGRGLRTRMISLTAITTLTSTRIYPEVLPQNSTLPAITYRTITGDAESHLLGISGLVHSRIQIDCFAATHISARAVHEQVRLAWVGYTGAAGSETIRGITEDNHFTNYQVPLDGSDQGRYVHTIDLLISHTEATS